MKKAMISGKFIILIVLIILNSMFSCGCWNYKDIEKSLLVTGFAIDKNEQKGKYQLTMEILDFEMSGKEAKQSTKIIESEGKTIFDAIRNAISIVGNKLYWPHADVCIISEQIAKEGLIPTLDFIYRDSEVRTELYILISKEKTAKEILLQEKLLAKSSSDNIYEMLQEQKNEGKFPSIFMYRLINYLSSGDAILPSIELKEVLGKKTANLTGTAIFKSDKLVGYINEAESQALLFVIDLVKGGIITVDEDLTNTSEVSLEIFKSKTKIKPSYIDDKLTMDIDIKLEVAIAEDASYTNYISGKNLLKLKKDAEEKVKTSVEELIQKVQLVYDADIFSFGLKINRDLPKVWRKVESDWNNTFKNLNTNVKVSINIRNSAIVKKQITKKQQ